MKKTVAKVVAPRSLQEAMELNGWNNNEVLRLVRERTGIVISPALFSMILRKGRRCSRINGLALHDVTGVSVDVLCQWPPYAERDKVSGGRSKRGD